MIKKGKEKEIGKVIYGVCTIIVMILIIIIIIKIASIKEGPEVEVIKEGEWSQKVMVKITKDVESKNKIEKYKYCVTEEEENKCEWEETKTKNFEVYKNGINKVYIKGVDEKGKESKATKIEVKIDNEAPKIKNVKIIEKSKESIKIKTDASDGITHIKYYYGINDEEYKEGNEEYTYEGLKEKTKYEIKVKVIDEAGNEKEVIIEGITE